MSDKKGNPLNIDKFILKFSYIWILYHKFPSQCSFFFILSYTILYAYNKSLKKFLLIPNGNLQCLFGLKLIAMLLIFYFLFFSTSEAFVHLAPSVTFAPPYFYDVTKHLQLLLGNFSF